MNAINDELQKQASDIIARNLLKFQRGNVNPAANSWMNGIVMPADIP